MNTELTPIVKDTGHAYELPNLDGDGSQLLRFVKRFDPQKYPGNADAYPGTTLQTVMRCLIERVKYLDNQIPCPNNGAVVSRLIECLWLLEERAAARHGYSFDYRPGDMLEMPMCGHCGHVVCKELGNAHH